MKFNPERHHRHSIRLKEYDYAQEGAYFVTVCTHNREIIFENERYRKIVEGYWFDLPRHYPHVQLDEFVVMPNHVHGIIVLVGAGSADRTGNSVRLDKPALSRLDVAAGSKTAPSPPHRAGLTRLRRVEPAPTISNARRHSLAEIVRFFKTYSAREINRLRRMAGEPVWQRNYFEHIIRSEETLNKIREYILANPAQWEADPENPAVGAGGRKDEMPEGLAQKV